MLPNDRLDDSIRDDLANKFVDDILASLVGPSNNKTLFSTGAYAALHMDKGQTEDFWGSFWGTTQHCKRLKHHVQQKRNV